MSQGALHIVVKLIDRSSPQVAIFSCYETAKEYFRLASTATSRGVVHRVLLAAVVEEKTNRDPRG